MVVAVRAPGSGRGRAPEERASARAAGRSGDPATGPMVSDPDLGVRHLRPSKAAGGDRARKLQPRSLIQATRNSDPEIPDSRPDGLVNSTFRAMPAPGDGFPAAGGRQGRHPAYGHQRQVIDAFIEVRPEVAQGLGRLVRGGSSMESRANAARAAGILRAKAALPTCWNQSARKTPRCSTNAW